MIYSRIGPLLLLLLLVGGCSKRVAVGGKVLENGNPISRAELRWIDDGESIFVSGVTDRQGQYRLDAGGRSDIPVGKYKVTVTWWRTPNGQPLPEGEEGTALKSKSQTFTAMLDVQVTATTTTLDLDVTGRGTIVPNP